MEALDLHPPCHAWPLKLATAFFGHGEARRVINLSCFDNPDLCPFWTFCETDAARPLDPFVRRAQVETRSVRLCYRR